MRALLVALLVTLVSTVVCQSYLDRNTTFIDNGNVCDTFDDPIFLPPTTCTISPASGGLNAALASCASDDFIVVTLGPAFADDGPIVFPDVQSIQLISPTQDALIRGGAHVVEGQFTDLLFSGITFDGEGTTDLLFDPPLRSTDLMLLDNTLITRFYGPKAILHEAGDDRSNVTMINSACVDVHSSCIASSGITSYNFQSNTFARCGGTPDSCVFLKHQWATLGRSIFFRNDCYLLWPELPPRCINFVDPAGFVRCNGETIECLDIFTTTEAGDCPLVDFTYYDNATMTVQTIQVFEEFCRRYRPCQCEQVRFVDASNFTSEDVVVRVGDVIYPTITLTCQPGSVLVGGGTAVATDEINILDPSFEASWPVSTFWQVDSPVPFIFNSTDVNTQFAQDPFNYEPD